MNMNYIIYGFSRTIFVFLMVVAIGVSLKLLNINNSIKISVIIFNLLLIFCGYKFVEKSSKEKYKNSLFLSIIISFSFALIFSLFNEFELLIIFKNILSILFFISIGIFSRYIVEFFNYLLK